MRCNICGNDTFRDVRVRKKVHCTKCGSLERTRLFWMYIERLKIDKTSKILHFAPEKGLYDALSARTSKENYIIADLEPERYPFVDECIKVDLCDLDSEPSCQYDFIFHLHVLEHTPCNIAYTLFHLHRMLKVDGRHICVIPFLHGKYDECFQELSADVCYKRFGQFDHVRRFGADDIPSHLGKLINVPTEFDATKDFDTQELRDANIPEDHWKGFHVGTVLDLKRNDMKLLR